MSGIPISSKYLFSLNISIFVRNENSKNWPDGVLVHRCINSRVTTLAVYAIAALVCAPLRSVLNVCHWHTAPSVNDATASLPSSVLH